MKNEAHGTDHGGRNGRACVSRARCCSRACASAASSPCGSATRKGLEAKLVPPAQIEIEWISMSGLRGKGAATLLLAPFKVAAVDLAEPAGHASSQARRRARLRWFRRGSWRCGCVAHAPAAGDPRTERGRRHDESHAGEAGAPRARSVSDRASRREHMPSRWAIRCDVRSPPSLRPSSVSPAATGPTAFAGHRRQPGRDETQRRSAGGARISSMRQSRPVVIHQAGERHIDAGARDV